MRPFPSRVVVIAVLAAIVVLPSSAPSQRFEWPEPENLQVLPDTFTGRQVSNVMRGFSEALGVRCSHCHVGEEGQPLHTFDFVSDENPNKNVARSMLRMLGVINDSLRTIEPSGPERVNMWCHTCHRGRPRPMTLAEEIREQHTLHGVEAALAHYRDLRERFHGRGAYRFDDEPLNVLGYLSLEEGDVDRALEAFELNVELHPDAWNAHDSLGEAYLAAGDTTRAVASYERALELNPRNDHAREVLAGLRGP